MALTAFLVLWFATSARGSAYTGLNCVTKSRAWIRMGYQGIVVGTAKGHKDAHREKDCGSAARVYVAHKSGGFLWGLIESDEFKGCGWISRNRVTNRSHGSTYRDHAATCAAPPPREPWTERRAVFRSFADPLRSPPFVRGRAVFCRLRLPQPKTFETFPNYTTGRQGRRVGNVVANPGLPQGPITTITTSSLRIRWVSEKRWRRTAKDPKSDRYVALVMRGGKGGPKSWQFVAIERADVGKIDCSEARAASSSSALSSIAADPSVSCDDDGICIESGFDVCDTDGMCRTCGDELCGEVECDGTEPDGDPECGWICNAECEERTSQSECCALCSERAEYHAVGDNSPGCRSSAEAYCAQGGRGDFLDAAWSSLQSPGDDQCVGAPGHCAVECQDGRHTSAAHVPSDQICIETAHGACRGHDGVAAVHRDGRELYRLPARPCTARCCNGDVTGTVDAVDAGACETAGAQMCTAQGSSLHHVRYQREEQPPHGCPANCCALCRGRLAYHLVTEADGSRVWEGCADAAVDYCSEADRGGLDDAAWVALKHDGTDQCEPPPGYCRMLCHDGHEDVRHVAAEQGCWDASHDVCASHAGTEVLTLDGRELYRRPVHTCTVSCCDGAVVGPVNSDSAAACIYQEGPPLCAGRGSTIDHVRYDGRLVKDYDCPQTCTARCCNGAVIGSPATTSAAQCDSQGVQACAAQGTSLSHVRFGGVEQGGHPCPQLCYTHCCDGRQAETWFNSQGECSSWAGAVCGNIKVNTIHYPKYNVIYNADSCRCCAKCSRRSNAYNMGPQVNCTDRGRDWCSRSDRGGLQNAFWGSCPDPPN